MSISNLVESPSAIHHVSVSLDQVRNVLVCLFYYFLHSLLCYKDIFSHYYSRRYLSLKPDMICHNIQYFKGLN